MREQEIARLVKRLQEDADSLSFTEGFSIAFRHGQLPLGGGDIINLYIRCEDATWHHAIDIESLLLSKMPRPDNVEYLVNMGISAINNLSNGLSGERI